MHREPSIHISRSNLIKLIKKHIKPKDDVEELVDDILIDAKKYSLSNRSLLATNQKQRQKADKIKESPLEDAMNLAKALQLVRRQLRHRGIEVIKPGDRNWGFIKTIAANANEYHEAFSFGGKPLAYTNYLQACFKRINKYSLPALQSIHPRVMEDVDALERLKSNDEPLYMDRALKEYNKHIIDKVGTLLTDYTKEPKEMTYFMDVAYTCRELKITPEIYIKAQFEGLAWAKGIPNPSQLVTDKAKERLQTYLFENEVKLVDEKADENRINRLKDLKKLKGK